MQYFIAFLEGIVTFISPCLLPMLPVYVTYFAGGEEGKQVKIIKNAVGFVLGFTAVFVAMGALAGFFGEITQRYAVALNIVTGGIVIFFGLSFLGLFRLSIFKGSRLENKKSLGFFSSILFGIVFSLGWTPCVGAFLGSALMLAASGGSTVQGVLMLLTYSVGLGIPFILSAVLIDKLKGAFDFIKKHYRAVNTVSGILLIAMGILMATGLFGKLLALTA